MHNFKGLAAIPALIAALLMASSVPLSVLGVDYAINRVSPGYKTVVFEKIFSPINHTDDIQKIQDALNVNDYELANKIYSDTFDHIHIEPGSQLEKDVLPVQKFVEYYRNYQYAKNIVYVETQKDWRAVVNNLKDMPDGFYFKNDVQEMIFQAEIALGTASTTATKAVVQTQYQAADSDPPVHCQISEKCGGGTRPLKKSECDNSICCEVNDGWKLYLDVNKCYADQGRGSGSSNQKIYPVIPNTITANNKIKCSYSSGKYYFDFGELPYEECQTKSKQYWDELSAKIGQSGSSSTTTTSTTTKVDNSAACRAQYNIEVQNANFLSAGAREGVISIATASLNRCLSSGNVEVNKLTIPSTPSPTINESNPGSGHTESWDTYNPF